MAVERRLDLVGARGSIPAIVWLPDDAGLPIPLVLVGHGGGGRKTDAYVAAMRDRLLATGVAIAAIDAVSHGERADADPASEAVVRVIGEAASYQRMVADWTLVLDALLASGDFEASAVGYVGLSGGTLFGLPFVAADKRIAATALGACGYESAPLLGDAPSTFAPILEAAARRYDRPALFLLQEQDDYFPPAGGRALFADLAATDKTLLVSPGTHTEVSPSALDDMAQWLVSRLSERQPGDLPRRAG